MHGYLGGGYLGGIVGPAAAAGVLAWA